MPLEEVFIYTVCVVATLWTLLYITHCIGSRRNPELAKHPFAPVLEGVYAVFLLIWVVTFVLWGVSQVWVALW